MAARGVGLDPAEEGGDGQSVSRHPPFPWFRPKNYVPGRPLDTLENEIRAFCELLKPTPAEEAKRASVVLYVQEMVLDLFGGRAFSPRTEVFGSQLTGLVLPSSDIDVAILGKIPERAFDLVAGEAERRLRNGEVTDLVVVRTAKVPLVKFEYDGIKVDIVVQNASGLFSGQAAKDAMNQMEQVRPLVLVLKYYLAQRGLHETYRGGIGSYLLQLMVVALVQKCRRVARGCTGVMPTNLGYLLCHFLDFYGNQLKYDVDGITLLRDGAFFDKNGLGWSTRTSPFQLTLQNPLELEQDTGAGAYKVTSWKNSFSSTLEYMNEAIDGAYRDGWDGRVRTVGILWNAITPEWSRELWERAPRGLTFRPTEVQQVLNGPEMAVELQELRAFSQGRKRKHSAQGPGKQSVPERNRKERQAKREIGHRKDRKVELRNSQSGQTEGGEEADEEEGLLCDGDSARKGDKEDRGNKKDTVLEAEVEEDEEDEEEVERAEKGLVRVEGDKQDKARGAEHANRESAAPKRLSNAGESFPVSLGFLCESTTAELLQAALSDGQVKLFCSIVTNYRGRFGVVRFGNEEAASTFITEKQGVQVDGRFMQVCAGAYGPGEATAPGLLDHVYVPNRAYNGEDTVVVRNMAAVTSSQDLLDTFQAKVQGVLSTKVLTYGAGPRWGCSRGQGMVKLTSADRAAEAVKSMNGSILHDRQLIVSRTGFSRWP